MEAYGFYHAEVVITPDKKAVSVYNITKSNKALLSDAVNRARER
jgi:hypothetical protein